jgi:hypothetical protein
MRSGGNGMWGRGPALYKQNYYYFFYYSWHKFYLCCSLWRGIREAFYGNIFLTKRNLYFKIKHFCWEIVKFYQVFRKFSNSFRILLKVRIGLSPFPEPDSQDCSKSSYFYISPRFYTTKHKADRFAFFLDLPELMIVGRTSKPFWALITVLGCWVGGVPVAGAHFWDRRTGTDAVSSRVKLCHTRIILCVRKIQNCTVLLVVVMWLRKSGNHR